MEDDLDFALFKKSNTYISECESVYRGFVSLDGKPLKNIEYGKEFTERMFEKTFYLQNLALCSLGFELKNDLLLQAYIAEMSDLSIDHAIQLPGILKNLR